MSGNYIKTNFIDEVNACLMKIKDSIINALKSCNRKLYSKVEDLENKVVQKPDLGKNVCI